MIASPHWAASLAGLDMLRRGGNAVDAAIAANAVLTVVYPASCGIGGDAFWLVYEPKTRTVVGYNGSGRAAAAIDAAQMRGRGLRAMPTRGAFAVTVPGAVHSWEDVAAAHGRFGLDASLEAAERYARDGFVLGDVVANYFVINDAVLRADPGCCELFWKNGWPRAGDLVRNLALAEVLARIRRRGAAAFYTGRVAEAIAKTLNRHGNPMTPADLSAHRTEHTTPVKVAWKGAEVFAHPPNSQAAVAPIVMGILAKDGAASDLDWTHLAIEAMKLAFDERDRRFAEPTAMKESIDDLLEPATHARMRASIDPNYARTRTSPVDRGGTIAVVAVDEDGRAVSLIESLYMNFGSGLIADGTGIFLQNRGAYFSLEPGHPNELGGGKRPLHTLAPGMLLRNGKPEFVYGTMGGDGQPQTHVQLIHDVYERGMSVQQAIDAPRFVYGRDSERALSDSTLVESRFPGDIIAGLRVRGHSIDILEPFSNSLGHAHAIAIDSARGTLAGGSDPRADGVALGL